MKKVLVLFILIFSSLFAKINDEMKFFNENDIKILNEKIENIEKEKEITIYVNTYSSDEDFIIEKSQNVIILDLIELSNKDIETELKFSKDIDLDDESKNLIDEILDTNQKPLEEKEYAKYVIDILDEIAPIIEKTNVEQPITNENNPKLENKYYFIILGLAIFVIFGIIVGKRKKKK